MRIWWPQPMSVLVAFGGVAAASRFCSSAS